jgi:hypothetical protein
MKKYSFLLTGVTIISCLAIGDNFGLFNDSSHAHQDKIESTTDDRTHKKLVIPQGEPIPTVSVKIYPDPMGGYNLQIETTNFKFAPENIGKTNSFREGHAHLYVDGKKITRIYSNWFYLSDLAAGERKITITLNSNEHEELLAEDRKIEAIATILVPETTEQ